MSLFLILALLQAPVPRLGTITFPTSGAAAAQPSFIRGVLYLHSFEYGDASQAFREAQRLDSTFAMAYWGEAMTFNHPVWNEQDAAAARAVLARAPRAPTARERAYLAAVRVLYGDGPKARRDTLYAQAMAEVFRAHPDDHEARAFYALALLGLNQGVRDVPTYLRAAELVERVFRANPDHPGAAHYLIHAYDDPAHAGRGLAAARAYSGIAPDAAHAQHMTTHIFLALGMWEDVEKQNAIASGADRDQWMPGHYTSWLGYALLQQGRFDEARRHLEAMRTNLAKRDTRGARSYLLTMRAHYLVNAEQWDDPARGWELSRTGLSSTSIAVDAFGLGFAALRRGDRAEAKRRLTELTEIRSAARAEGPNVAPARVPAILEKELAALLLFEDKRADEAIALLREAAALEDSLPVEFGPPDVVKPTHELLGEILLAQGKPEAAEREFRRALELGPGRRLALRGLTRATAAVNAQER